jgi:hypothetical protein
MDQKGSQDFEWVMIMPSDVSEDCQHSAKNVDQTI